MSDQVDFSFIFLDEQTVDRGNLSQGDLLHRTPELAAALHVAHAYYAEAKDYSHFLVLTQSCDLYRRQDKCKSRYITLCAVRPLSVEVDRELEKFTNSIPGFPFPVGEVEREILAKQYLDRVLNNTVDGKFFIPKDSAPTVDEHLCAFLALSVTLRVDHYGVCLAAKVAQADEIFSAKIGSLASSLYSRIATPDIHEKNSSEAVKLYREAFFEDLGLARVAWLSPVQKKALKGRVKVALAESGITELTAETALDLLEDLPNETIALAERAVEILVKRKLIENTEIAVRTAQSFLTNDPTFKKLTRR